MPTATTSPFPRQMRRAASISPPAIVIPAAAIVPRGRSPIPVAVTPAAAISPSSAIAVPRRGASAVTVVPVPGGRRSPPPAFHGRAAVPSSAPSHAVPGGRTAVHAAGTRAHSHSRPGTHGVWGRDLLGVESSGHEYVLVFSSEPRPPQPPSELPRQPVRYRMPPLHVHYDAPSLQPHPVGRPVGALHVLLVLVLHECVTPAPSRLLVGDQLEILHRTVRLHLSEHFAFGDLVREPSDEEGIVAVHPIGVLAAAPALLGAIRLDQGSELGVVLGLLRLCLVFLDGLGGGVDLSGGGRRPLEVVEEGRHARDAGPALAAREGGGDGGDAGVGTGLVTFGVAAGKIVVVRDVIL
mmetsp:Transcript_5163/g.11186  ORF Transcript_5163/g.11186 Transcript_5163/m.11186 type:complete len:352 (+) Transcript_5163:565-1620(+)